MSSHALDNQMNERLIKELEDLKKQLRDQRTTQAQGADAVNMQVSGDYTASFTFNPGDIAMFVFTFDNPQGRQIFSTFEFSMYQGSVHPDNAVENTGANIFIFNWEYRWWRSKALSDGTNQKECVWVKNLSDSVLTLYMVGRWRYVVSNGTGSAG